LPSGGRTYRHRGLFRVRQDDLLQLLGGLDLPTRGSVHIAGGAMNQLDDTERGLLRNQAVGFVYQYPSFAARVSRPSEKRRDVLVGEARTLLLPAREAAAAILTGWDWRRVSAIARRSSPAVSVSGRRSHERWSPRPRLLLADEPTGNLTAVNAAQVFELMLELNRELKTSL